MEKLATVCKALKTNAPSPPLSSLTAKTFILFLALATDPDYGTPAKLHKKQPTLIRICHERG
ncbi:hypothetical protein R50072_23670 [Simiduia litorea]